MPYTRTIPPSKKKTSSEQIKKIIQICQENSIYSSDTTLRRSELIESIIPGFLQPINYCLKLMKNTLFYLFKENFPKKSITKSTFYKYFPKKFILN